MLTCFWGYSALLGEIFLGILGEVPFEVFSAGILLFEVFGLLGYGKTTGKVLRGTIFWGEPNCTTGKMVVEWW